MDEGDGVTIIDGVIHIDHAEIEAGLYLLATRWQTTPQEALYIALKHELNAGRPTNGRTPNPSSTSAT